MDFGPANNDPSLSTIMRGREIVYGRIPVAAVMDGVKLDSAKARRYADQSTPLPAVVALEAPDGLFMVLDGNHRVRAAVLRGEDFIEAWVGSRSVAY